NNNYKKIITHNPDGDYQHQHHIAVFKTVIKYASNKSLYIFSNDKSLLPKKHLEKKIKLIKSFYKDEANTLLSDFYRNFLRKEGIKKYVKNLLAYHTNWTKPAISPKKEYSNRIFNIMATILSALEWRKNNGSIKLYTDKIGYNYYKNLNLLDIWDRGVDIETLENIPEDINPKVFFAAGKFYALEKEPLGSISIDRDLITWKNIYHKVENKKLIITHREAVGYHFGYIPKEKLVIPKGYEFEENLDWTINPCNMSLFRFNDQEFKDKFINHLKFYIKGNDDIKLQHDIIIGNYVAEMLFVEQRYVSMLAKKMDIDINPVLKNEILENNWDNMIYNPEGLLTHIWVFKKNIDRRPKDKEWLTRRLLMRIYNDYPKYFNILIDKFPELSKYVDKYFISNKDKIDYKEICYHAGISLDLI
ncbi:MAG: DUF6734 family protein, partial [archaeon]